MIKFIALSGFLGAGKTTTLIAAARALERQGRRVAVVTNDQGSDLVDTQLVRSSLDRVAQVTGGCFCCRFEDLLTVVESLLEQDAADTVIAEAVGSCTDLQATVVRPLRKYYGDQFSVAPLTTVVDPGRLRAFAGAARRGEPESDLSYLFSNQLTEADVIAVNKADLVAADELDRLVAELAAAHPHRRILTYSAKTGDGIDALVEAWDGSASWTEDLDIDYDRYAAAEAQLAWLNHQLVVRATAGPDFDPAEWATVALTHLAESAQNGDAEIGHAKIAITTEAGLTKASVTERGAVPTLDLVHPDRAVAGQVTINARVACEPADLDRWVQAAIEQASTATGVSATAAEDDPAAFKPGYPTPLHHILAAQM